jgi:protein-disulfide isomerase
MQTSSSSSSPTRFDTVALATLVGIVFMMALAAVNLWNLNRLTARVATIEAALSPRKPPPGPDPKKIHSINIVGAQVKGPANAPVTIVEFSDFQCPFCARVVPTLKQLEDTYKGNVRIVWKHLPLDIHKDAVGAARAAEVAAKQGKFWEFHDKLFADQKKLGPDDLKQHARELRLDMKRFETDLLNSEDQKKIDNDVAEAKALGINGTPGIFVNGRFVEGAQPYEVFAKIIDEELTKRGVARPSASTE